jgi:hypothetical protein
MMFAEDSILRADLTQIECLLGQNTLGEFLAIQNIHSHNLFRVDHQEIFFWIGCAEERTGQNY